MAEDALSTRAVRGIEGRWADKPPIVWRETAVEPITAGAVGMSKPARLPGGGMTFVAEENEEGWRRHTYYVDERWVVYQDWDDGTLRPCFEVVPKVVLDFAAAQANVAGRLVPCIDSGAPYRCSGCGTDRLHVCRNGPESMILRCPECGGEGVEVDIA